MRIPGLLVLIFSPVVVLAIACGGGSGGVSGTSTAQSDTSEPAQEDQALVEAMLLNVGDFPAGWAEEPTEDDESPFDDCDPGTPEGRTARAETGTFSPGGSRDVSQTIGIFEAPAQVARALSEILGIGDCLVQVVDDGKLDNDEFSYSDATFSSLSFPQQGDSSDAIRFKVHASSNTESGFGSEVDIYIDVVSVIVGRVGFSIEASDVLTPFNTSELEDIVSNAVAKVQKELSVDGQAASPTRQSTVQPSPPPASTPEFGVGDTLDAGSLELTLHAYDAAVSASSEFLSPEPGSVFAAIDVEGCTDANLTGSASLNPFDFRLQLPDNQRLNSSIAAVEPSLNHTELLADDCVRGFVTFQVPEDIVPQYVVYEGRSPSFDPIVLKWLVNAD